MTQTNGLLHGEETMVFVSAGYQAAAKKPEASVYAKVRASVQAIKRQFGCVKARHRGLPRTLRNYSHCLLFTVSA